MRKLPNPRCEFRAGGREENRCRRLRRIRRETQDQELDRRLADSSIFCNADSGFHGAFRGGRSLPGICFNAGEKNEAEQVQTEAGITIEIRSPMPYGRMRVARISCLGRFKRPKVDG